MKNRTKLATLTCTKRDTVHILGIRWSQHCHQAASRIKHLRLTLSPKPVSRILRGEGYSPVTGHTSEASQGVHISWRCSRNRNRQSRQGKTQYRRSPILRRVLPSTDILSHTGSFLSRLKVVPAGHSRHHLHSPCRGRSAICCHLGRHPPTIRQHVVQGTLHRRGSRMARGRPHRLARSPSPLRGLWGTGSRLEEGCYEGFNRSQHQSKPR